MSTFQTRALAAASLKRTDVQTQLHNGWREPQAVAFNQECKPTRFGPVTIHSQLRLAIAVRRVLVEKRPSLRKHISTLSPFRLGRASFVVVPTQTSPFAIMGPPLPIDPNSASHLMLRFSACSSITLSPTTFWRCLQVPLRRRVLFGADRVTDLSRPTWPAQRGPAWPEQHPLKMIEKPSDTRCIAVMGCGPFFAVQGTKRAVIETASHRRSYKRKEAFSVRIMSLLRQQ